MITTVRAAGWGSCDILHLMLQGVQAGFLYLMTFTLVSIFILVLSPGWRAPWYADWPFSPLICKYVTSQGHVIAWVHQIIQKERTWHTLWALSHLFYSWRTLRALCHLFYSWCTLWALSHLLYSWCTLWALSRLFYSWRTLRALSRLFYSWRTLLALCHLFFIWHTLWAPCHLFYSWRTLLALCHLSLSDTQCWQCTSANE